MGHSLFLNLTCDILENKGQGHASLPFLEIDMPHWGSPVKGPSRQEKVVGVMGVNYSDIPIIMKGRSYDYTWRDMPELLMIAVTSIMNQDNRVGSCPEAMGH